MRVRHAWGMIDDVVGAGTVIETLSAGKPLIVVVNDTLMGNHQTELADRLAKDGVLLSSTPR